jgi:pimeloyl-ACP methyl ester carboxylesterase
MEVELCAETFGDPADPTVLLVMGMAASMDRWPTPFCERLAAAGRHVVRYDHRDTGQSATDPPGKPSYDGGDLAADSLRVLDRLGVERAHLVGMSMGGALAMLNAIAHPARWLSLTLMSTSAMFPGLPGMSEGLKEAFASPPPEPDWADREATIAYLLEVERPYAGSRGLDEPALRELLGVVYDRSRNLASADNHGLADGPDLQRDRLAELRLPTLVIHGTDDPLFPLPHGEALAAAIPGARLLVIDGMGHEVPRWAWDEIVPAIVEVTA